MRHVHLDRKVIEGNWGVGHQDRLARHERSAIDQHNGNNHFESLICLIRQGVSGIRTVVEESTIS
jgi:hypothetical protein